MKCKQQQQKRHCFHSNRMQNLSKYEHHLMEVTLSCVRQEHVVSIFDDSISLLKRNTQRSTEMSRNIVPFHKLCKNLDNITTTFMNKSTTIRSTEICHPSEVLGFSTTETLPCLCTLHLEKIVRASPEGLAECTCQRISVPSPFFPSWMQAVGTRNEL